MVYEYISKETLRQMEREILEDILKQMERDRADLSAFCREYNIHLTTVEITSERFPEVLYEAMYFFDDGLGGYTIDGIKNSLNEKK